MNELLQKVIKNSRIIGIRLVSVSATHIYDGEAEHEIEVDLKTYPPQITRNADRRLLLGKFRLHVFGKNKKNQSKAPVDITIEMEAAYQLLDDGITEKDCTSFVEQNVPFNIWPFSRELVHNLTSRMLINPPLMLPLFKPFGEPADSGLNKVGMTERKKRKR